MLGRIVKSNMDDAQYEEREDKGRYPQVEDPPTLGNFGTILSFFARHPVSPVKKE